MKRPLRITLLAIYIIISASVNIFGQVHNLLQGTVTPMVTTQIPQSTLSIIALIGSSIALICAIFLLKRNATARKVLTAYLIFSASFAIYNTFTMNISALLAAAPGVISEKRIYLLAVSSILLTAGVPLIILYTSKSNKYFSLEKIRSENMRVAQTEDQSEFSKE